MNPFEHFKRLPGFRHTGDGQYIARCPAHDDKTASLSIRYENGKIVVYCHAGCPIESIIGKMGLRITDLFTDNGDNWKSGFQPRIAAVYPYADTDGALLYQVVRYIPKDFRQRRPDGNGGWIWDAKSVARVPYRLSEVINADCVFVVEGEKDADNLIGLGLVGTCIAGGSGARWTTDVVKHFRSNQNIVVIPDNDPPGERYALAAARALRQKVASLKILRLTGLPSKGDVSDWIKMRELSDAKAELLRLAERAPEWMMDNEREPQANAGDIDFQASVTVEMTRGDLLCIEAVCWLWPDWLAIGKVHILGGAPGTGKTTIAMSFAAAATNGMGWPDAHRSEPGEVVIWSGEDNTADTLAPRLAARGADMRRVHFVGNVSDPQNGRRMFDPARDTELLRVQMQRIGNIKMLIIDPIVNAVQGDSHKNADVRKSLQPLVDLAAVEKVALLGITHFSKGTAGREPVERITGSLAFGALARVVMVVAKRAGDDEAATHVFCRAKSNIGRDDGGFEYRLIQEPLRDNPAIVASRLEWGMELCGSAREILADAEDAGGESAGGRTDDAVGFLRQKLANGRVHARQIYKDAEGSDIKKRTIDRAKKRIGVVAVKEKDGWFWALPSGEIWQGCQDCQPEKVGNLGNLEL